MSILRLGQRNWKRNIIGTRLGLSRDRFNEIQAVFTFRNPDILPMQPSDPWWFRPLASSIRDSCQRCWIPGAKVAVDEGMIAYHGHTRHTIKAPHKPIKQGFKFWALGDHGFIYNWLWYSRTDGTEATRRSGLLAETQALVLNLARSLPRNLVYNLYLDNLFTNVPLAKELLELNIGMTDTTRKNALGFPRWLVKLKEQGKSRGKAMEWRAMRAEVVEGVLCFAWQDNNTVLGMTTAYSPDDLVIRTRKRPAQTSTNAAIVRPVFGDEYTKDLAIPNLIDAYNHHMGGVDIANQLRATYSAHNRRQNLKVLEGSFPVAAGSSNHKFLLNLPVASTSET
jgi:Transposase IS4